LPSREPAGDGGQAGLKVETTTRCSLPVSADL
jgi:hypothetical protein